MVLSSASTEGAEVFGEEDLLAQAIDLLDPQLRRNVLLRQLIFQQDGFNRQRTGFGL